MLKQKWGAGEACLTMEDLRTKLSSLSTDLRKWDKQSFGNIRWQIGQLQRELGELRRDPLRLGPSPREEEITRRLVELFDQEEVMWRQRSSVQWLAAGDKNTHFFHMRASQRRKKNTIVELKREDGSLASGKEELGEMASSFYKELYTSEGIQGLEEVMSLVPVKVSSGMNEMLDSPFDAAEVKKALFEMYPTKAPGPDGFPAHFFQRNWELCGEEVTKAVLRILAGEESPSVVNKTFIVMIPKVASPEEMGQFRPISLCNIVYKIASKVVANRLKRVLP
jgi:hypothetical protein